MAQPPPGLNLAPRLLEELACTRMPFGKYAGRLLLDLPEPYVLWLHRQGGLRGHLGVLFGSLVEIKINGLESLLEPLRPREDDREGTALESARRWRVPSRRSPRG